MGFDPTRARARQRLPARQVVLIGIAGGQLHVAQRIEAPAATHDVAVQPEGTGVLVTAFQMRHLPLDEFVECALRSDPVVAAAAATHPRGRLIVDDIVATHSDGGTRWRIFGKDLVLHLLGYPNCTEVRANLRKPGFPQRSCDWTHGNAIQLLADGRILVNFLILGAAILRPPSPAPLHSWGLAPTAGCPRFSTRGHLTLPLADDRFLHFSNSRDPAVPGTPPYPPGQNVALEFGLRNGTFHWGWRVPAPSTLVYQCPAGGGSFLVPPQRLVTSTVFGGLSVVNLPDHRPLARWRSSIAYYHTPFLAAPYLRPLPAAPGLVCVRVAAMHHRHTAVPAQLVVAACGNTTAEQDCTQSRRHLHLPAFWGVRTECLRVAQKAVGTVRVVLAAEGYQSVEDLPLQAGGALVLPTQTAPHTDHRPPPRAPPGWRGEQ